MMGATAGMAFLWRLDTTDQENGYQQPDNQSEQKRSE